MNIWKKIILFILFSVGFKSFAQQDAQFSQYMFSGMYINPAYAGFKEALTINTFYRSQWSGFDGAPTTMTMSVDSPVGENSALGLQIANDEVGLTSEFSTYAVYSYRLRLNEESDLRFGLGMGVYKFSMSEGTIVDEGDPVVTTGSSSITPDMKFGVYYNTQTYYLGLSFNNMLSPMITKGEPASSLQPVKSTQMYFTGGLVLPLADDYILKPSFLYKQDFQGTASLDINASVLLYDLVWVGASYRSGFNFSGNGGEASTYSPSAFAFITEFFVKDRLRIGYAYDFSMGDVGEIGQSAHEISLTYSFSKDMFKNDKPKENKKKEKEIEKQLEDAEKEAERIRKQGGMASPRFF